jgi:CobQ-like glutamine amidotransferase family enzyme
VVAGVGNGDGTEGAIAGHLIGTYLHGPGLARNPAVADLLLSWCVGETLEAVLEPDVEALREERLRSVLGDSWNRAG